MNLKIKGTLAGLGAFHLLTWTPPAWAQSIQTQVVESALNNIKDVTTSSGEEQKKFCVALLSSVSALKPVAASSPKMQPLLKKAESIHKKFCNALANSVVVPVVVTNWGTQSLSSSHYQEDAPVAPAPAEPVQDEAQVWKDQPSCVAGNSNSHLCRFRHESGRGMFIYRQPGVYSFPNYLVCAMTAGQSGGAFSSGYAITSRCLVSSADWRAYASNVGPDLSARSDVQGLLTWMYQDSYMAPMAMSGSLYSQCRDAFSDSLFCSPSLIVLPTQVPEQVDVCKLDSRRSALNLGIIKISSGSSKWTCTRTDLRLQERDEILSTQEENCVPNMLGQVDPQCDLPYIPRAQQPIRVNHERIPFTP